MPIVARTLGVVMTGVGAGWMTWAACTLGAARFVGRAPRAPALVLRGPFRYLRHPFYAGMICLLAGIGLLSGSAAIGVVLSLAAAGIGGWIVVEERRLAARFGEAYRRYRAAVPALVPRLRSRYPSSLSNLAASSDPTLS